MTSNKKYQPQKKNQDQNQNTKKPKEKFDTTTEEVKSGYEDIIDLLSVSPTASDPNVVSWKDQLNDYVILFLKYLFLVAILTLNFLGLSVSLNCNADQELFTRVVSAIFAFFFGFVYLIINYYTYKVLSQGKICKMNREKLFPFKA
jgi:hypothetical protein